jgi:CheY-like chemotaxis protein
VTVAASGQEALDRSPPGDAGDLLFYDVVMLGGHERRRAGAPSSERYAVLPILLTTVCGAGAQQVVDGGFPLLTKPYRPKVLATTIDHLLQTPRHVDA